MKEKEAESLLQGSIQAIINVELRRFENLLRFVTYVEKVLGRMTHGKQTTSSQETHEAH